MLLRLTKQFSFEMAHALPAYEGKCHNIHGHSYKLFVTVEGAPLQQQGAPTDGMVLDFHQLKEIVNRHIVEQFDHALVLPRKGQEPDDSTDSPIQLGGYAAKLILVDFQPTSENLLLHFARLLNGQLPAGTRLHSLKLYETETSCAELIL
ncbi:MAG: 6-carboxytetrahydropterin synthase [Bacteroidales bacterium]|nr:6-carboxytetrahydropterin synthase [Bacteroidales bacterium]